MCRQERGIRWKLDEVDHLRDITLDSASGLWKREATSEAALVDETSSFIDYLRVQFVRLQQRERCGEGIPRDRRWSWWRSARETRISWPEDGIRSFCVHPPLSSFFKMHGRCSHSAIREVWPPPMCGSKPDCGKRSQAVNLLHPALFDGQGIESLKAPSAFLTPYFPQNYV